MVYTAKVSLKMPEPFLSIRVTDHWFNELYVSAILFQMWNSQVDSNAFNIFVHQMLIYKTFNPKKLCVVH